MEEDFFPFWFITAFFFFFFLFLFFSFLLIFLAQLFFFPSHQSKFSDANQTVQCLAGGFMLPRLNVPGGNHSLPLWSDCVLTPWWSYGQNTSHLWPGRVGFTVHSNFVQVCTVLELLRIVLKSASPHTFTAGPFEISSKTFHFYFRRSRTQTCREKTLC